MQTFDQALARLVQDRLVTVEDAAEHSSNRHEPADLKQIQLA